MRSFLGQIRRRQIDHDSLRRQRQPHCRDCTAHALATFGDRLVGQPDDMKRGQARDKLHLHFDGARLQPQIRGG